MRVMWPRSHFGSIELQAFLTTLSYNSKVYRPIDLKAYSQALGKSRWLCPKKLKAFVAGVANFRTPINTTGRSEQNFFFGGGDFRL